MQTVIVDKNKDPYLASTNQTISGSGPKYTELTDEYGQPIEPDGLVQIWNKKETDAVPTSIVFNDTVEAVHDFTSGRMPVMPYYNIHFHIAPMSKLITTGTSE